MLTKFHLLFNLQIIFSLFLNEFSLSLLKDHTYLLFFTFFKLKCIFNLFFILFFILFIISILLINQEL